MNPLFEAAREIQDFMSGKGWKFCIIGGMAVMRWGEPRTTQDVDITLLTGFGHEEDFVQPLLAHFPARNPNALKFALQKRVALLKASNGKSVDISLGAFPFEEEMITRATPFEFAPGLHLVTCSAEDLIVLKAFAGRHKDLADIESIAMRQRKTLNKNYILRTLRPLCELKEAPELIAMTRCILEGKKWRK